MAEYDYSFLSIVFGHARVLSILPQTEAILVSIANDHGPIDRWELICSTNRKKPKINHQTTPHENSPLFSTDTCTKLDDDGHTGGTTVSETKEPIYKQLFTSLFSFFRSSNEEINLRPYHKEVKVASKSSYPKVSELKDTLLEISLEMSTRMKKKIKIPNIEKEFTTSTCSIHNPPKSSKKHSIFTFGVHRSGEKESASSECLYMRIYATRELPKKSINFPSRAKILAKFIKKCKSECMSNRDIILIYDYYSSKLNDAMCCSDKKETSDKVNEIIKEMNNLTAIEWKRTAEKVSDDIGPITLLLFFSRSKDNENENLQIISEYLLENMENQSDEKLLIVELKSAYTSIEDEMKDKIESKPLSPKSVRMIMKELSTFCTKYSNRSASHASIVFSVLLKSWIERNDEQ